MSVSFVDADVIIRLLTGDDPAKQAAAQVLFEHVRAGTTTLATPVTTIADVAYVLTSKVNYRVPRREVSEMLVALVRLPHLLVPRRRDVIRALELFGATKLDFGDAMLVAAMESSGMPQIYSYDHDFDRVSGVVRVEP